MLTNSEQRTLMALIGAAEGQTVTLYNNKCEHSFCLGVALVK